MAHLNGTAAETPSLLVGGLDSRHNPIRYTVLEAVNDWRGVLVAVKRPNGRRAYLGRYYRDEMGGHRVAIYTSLGFVNA